MNLFDKFKQHPKDILWDILIKNFSGLLHLINIIKSKI